MQGDDELTAQTDSLLLQRFLAGDQASFEELFLRYHGMVFGTLYHIVGSRQEAEDLAQEVFLKLYRLRMRHDANIGGWLYRVAVRMGLNANKSTGRRLRRDTKTAQLDLIDARPAEPEDETQRRETAAHVRDALTRIPERDAQLLVLSQMGHNYKEIAEYVGVAPGSVGTLLARARKTFLSAYGDDEEKAHDGH